MRYHFYHTVVGLLIASNRLLRYVVFFLCPTVRIVPNNTRHFKNQFLFFSVTEILKLIVVAETEDRVFVELKSK